MELVPLPFGLSLQVGDVIDQDGDRLSEGVALHACEVEHGCQPDLRAAQTVAALYVDPKGVYANLPNVEVWDEARDARQYVGPWPVVAHPPCKTWCLMSLCRPEIPRGEDGGCFAAALDAVRRFGGVLEHPAHSLAWDAYDLPEPRTREGWTLVFCGGWACWIDQGKYDGPMRKPTWLYYYGAEPPAMRWGDGGMKAEVVRHSHAPSATPPLFRDTLLAMARATDSARELTG